MNQYKKLIRPILFGLDAERAHELAILGLKTGLVPRAKSITDDRLVSEHWGLTFPNPVGLAAGFDKNCSVAGPLINLGFGFVETGTVTPRPQVGNPKPRMFRLTEDNAIINRLGFNNIGLTAFKNNLEKWKSQFPGAIIGANIGKNKDTEDDTSDYKSGIETLNDISDYLVINISSPNTPNLRDIQNIDRLRELLAVVGQAREGQSKSTPILLKIAPDLAQEDLEEIADECLKNKIDGIIATNTTIARPTSLASDKKDEAGGLSGEPLFDPSTAALRRLFSITRNKIPLVGVGGVSSGKQLIDKIRAGASLVQIYSAMIYEGPYLAAKLNRELLAYLDQEGISLSELVGDQREPIDGQ